MDLNKIYELAKKAKQKPPFINQGMFPPSRYYRFLYELTKYKNPKISVELGVCGGGGSYNLLRGTDNTVIGIDISNEYSNHIEYLKTFSNYIFWLGDSIKLSKEVYTMYGEIDLLFIDTVHTYDQTIKEFKSWYPYLSHDAIVILDDLYREGMEEAWQYLIRNYGYGVRLDNLHVGGSPTDGGFGVIYNIKPYQ